VVLSAMGDFLDVLEVNEHANVPETDGPGMQFVMTLSQTLYGTWKDRPQVFHASRGWRLFPEKLFPPVSVSFMSGGGVFDWVLSAVGGSLTRQGMTCWLHQSKSEAVELSSSSLVRGVSESMSSPEGNMAALVPRLPAPVAAGAVIATGVCRAAGCMAARELIVPEWLSRGA
jgi:hypothetical protein